MRYGFNDVLNFIIGALVVLICTILAGTYFGILIGVGMKMAQWVLK